MDRYDITYLKLVEIVDTTYITPCNLKNYKAIQGSMQLAISDQRIPELLHR